MKWHMDLVGCKFNPRPDHQECRFHLTHRVHRRPRVICAPGRMDFVGCKFNLRQDHTRVGLPVVITDQSASLAAQARTDRTDRPVFLVYIAEWHTDLLGCKFNPRQDHHEGRVHLDTSCTPTASWSTSTGTHGLRGLQVQPPTRTSASRISCRGHRSARILGGTASC